MTLPQELEPARRPVRRRRGLPVLVPVLVLLLAAGAALVARTPAGAAALEQREQTRALVLSGSSLPYPAARRLIDGRGFDARVYVVPGGGISRSALDPRGSITAAARRVLPPGGPAPDVVLVQGGDGDQGADPATLDRAMAHLLDYVGAHAPHAQVVLVGPLPGPVVPPGVHAVNDVLHEVARNRGVPYLDAVAAGWQAGDPALRAELSRVLSGT